VPPTPNRAALIIAIYEYTPSWARFVPVGVEVLCIGCLERRLGRTLCASDFTNAPINDPHSRESPIAYATD
jgi:hypothetical protein